MNPRAVLRGLAAASTSIAAAVGIAQVSGWMARAGFDDSSTLLPALAALWPGVALLLAGLGIGALLLGRARLVAVLAVLLVGLSVAALVQFALSSPPVTDLPLPRNPWDWPYVRSAAPLFSLVMLTAALGLLAGAPANRERLRIMALGTLGAVVTAIALLSVVSFLALWMGGDPAGRLRAMGLGPSIGTLAVGIAMMVVAGLSLLRHRSFSAEPAVPDAAPFAGIAFAVMLTLTFIAFAWMTNDYEAQLRARFKRATVNAVDDIGDRIPAFKLALEASAHYVQTVGTFARADWVRHLDAFHVADALPGLLSYGYMEALLPERLPDHLRRMQVFWPDGYQVFPAGARELYFPIVVMEPLTPQRRTLIGFDQASEPNRFEAIRRARDSGQVTISRSLVLVQDVGKPNEYSFQLYMPVYRKGAPVETLEQRQRALVGVVFSPFRMNTFMRSIFLDRYTDLRVRVLDGDFTTGAKLIYDSAGNPDGSVLLEPLPGTVALGAIVLGNRWTVMTSPLPGFFSSDTGSGSWIVLGAGLLIAVLLGAAIWQVFLIQARVRSLAAAQALHAESESRLQAEQALRIEREAARVQVEALNHQLSARAAELEIANRDLEAFSYSVSHDLQQPVTTIAAYAGMALEDFTDKMDPEVSDFFRRIQVAGFRMSQLISGLLALSSIARSELTVEPVDLSALAREALAELAATHTLRQIDLRIADGLKASGDKRLLQILVTNLLSNAWKYTGKTEGPRIEMGVEATADGPAFFVRDNGAGFDISRAEKLFSPFHRMHKEGEFAGTGIGLATCYRIVMRHGGKIWAEAAPGRGATFYFTVPG